MFALAVYFAVGAGLRPSVFKWENEIVFCGNHNIQGLIVETHFAVFNEARQTFHIVIGAIVENIRPYKRMAVPIHV